MAFPRGILKAHSTVSNWRNSRPVPTDDLYKYLNGISSEYADSYIRTGEWPSDVQIPKSPSVLHADGGIDWKRAPKGGYALDGNGEAIRAGYIPQVGDIYDRFGPAEGRYTSPIVDGKPFDYGQRALPFVEDMSQYHQYQVAGDISKLQDYVANSHDLDLKTEINGAIDYFYNGDYSQAIPYKGYVAGIDGWGRGGGLQVEFPIKISWLIKLGILKEIRQTKESQ